MFRIVPPAWREQLFYSLSHRFWDELRTGQTSKPVSSPVVPGTALGPDLCMSAAACAASRLNRFLTSGNV